MDYWYMRKHEWISKIFCWVKAASHERLHVILMCVCVCVCTLSPVWLFATPWIAAHQAPLSMEFSRQEYWNWFHFRLYGIFLTQGSNPCPLRLLNWQVDCLLLCHLGNPTCYFTSLILKSRKNQAVETESRPLAAWGWTGVAIDCKWAQSNSEGFQALYSNAVLWWLLLSCINVFKLTCAFKMSEFSGTGLTHWRC